MVHVITDPTDWEQYEDGAERKPLKSSVIGPAMTCTGDFHKAKKTLQKGQAVRAGDEVVTDIWTYLCCYCCYTREMIKTPVSEADAMSPEQKLHDQMLLGQSDKAAITAMNWLGFIITLTTVTFFTLIWNSVKIPGLVPYPEAAFSGILVGLGMYVYGFKTFSHDMTIFELSRSTWWVTLLERGFWLTAGGMFAMWFNMWALCWSANFVSFSDMYNHTVHVGLFTGIWLQLGWEIVLLTSFVWPFIYFTVVGHYESNLAGGLYGPVEEDDDEEEQEQV